MANSARQRVKSNKTYEGRMHPAFSATEQIIHFLVLAVAIYGCSGVLAPRLMTLGSNETFWTKVWGYIYTYFEGNPFYMTVIGVTVVFNGVFWLTGLFYLFLDLTGKPTFLTRYKIQPDKNNPVKLNQLKYLLIQIFINQTITWAPLVLGFYYAMDFCGCKFGKDLPEFFTVITDTLVFVAIEEIAFYYSHRLLHHPVVYKYIHKRHHEWTAPIAISAIYAHPIEFIFSNAVPLAIGPLIMKSHITTVWLWNAIGIIGTMNHHSGYHFPFIPSNEFHDFHHQTFNQNYGLLGLLDWIHGTDNLFKKNLAFKRHHTFFGFTPVRIIISADRKSK